MTDEKYKDHVKKGWCFAQETASELVNELQLRSKLSIAIFEKMVSPLHYFMQGKESEETTKQIPTGKQIEFAKRLEIQDPEEYSKDELSKKIDEMLKIKRVEKND